MSEKRCGEGINLLKFLYVTFDFALQYLCYLLKQLQTV